MALKKLEKRVHHFNQLFTATLKGQYDARKPWSAVRALRHSGSRLVFDKAARWCLSRNPRKRERGADILCQIHTGVSGWNSKKPYIKLFADESFSLLTRMLQNEHNEDVILSVIYGLGHLDQDQAVPFLIPFASSSNRLRYAATRSLGSLHTHPKALQSLLLLADDPDHNIRDWALFAIGTQSEEDTPELRVTLARHLDDPFRDAREEATAGLAKRKDPRALQPVIRLLESGSYFRYHESDFAALANAPEPAVGWSTDTLSKPSADNPRLRPWIQRQLPRPKSTLKVPAAVAEQPPQWLPQESLK